MNSGADVSRGNGRTLYPHIMLGEFQVPTKNIDRLPSPGAHDGRGHIKFWSIPTLTTLLSEAGFQNIRFHRVGRMPALAKSMIAVAQKPRA